MQGTTNFGNHIARSIAKQTSRVLHNPTAFHTAVDMFNSYAPASEVPVECLLFFRQRPTAWFLIRRDARDACQRERQKPQILQ